MTKLFILSATKKLRPDISDPYILGFTFHDFVWQYFYEKVKPTKRGKYSLVQFFYWIGQ